MPTYRWKNKLDGIARLRRETRIQAGLAGNFSKKETITTPVVKSLMVAAFVAATAVPAAADTLLGARTVADNSETDVILAAGDARFNAVRICVAGRAVRFRDLDIVFQNGGRQDAPVRAVIAPGECTRWINLRGPARNINRVVLRYDALVNAGPQPVVTAFAR